MKINIDITVLHRYLAKECSDEEKVAIHQWLKKSHENRELYDAVVKLWDIAPEKGMSFDIDKAWEQLESRIKSVEATQSLSEAAKEKTETVKSINVSDKKRASGRKQRRTLSRRESPFAMFAKIAAVLLLTGGLSLLIYQTFYFEDSSDDPVADQIKNEPRTFEADYGVNLELQLPDETKVTLNSGSRLTISADYNLADRRVELDGEAYFQVIPSDERPFYVTTSEASVRVLGTTFNVTSWSEREQSVILVESGRVGVYGNGVSGSDTDPVILTENQRVFVNRGETPTRIETVDPAVYLSWINGGMFFEDARLENVFKYLERRFNVKIDAKDEEINRRIVNARYMDESLEEILEITSITHDLEFQKENGRITVVKI